MFVFLLLPNRKNLTPPVWQPSIFRFWVFTRRNEGIISLLRNAQANADKQLPDDDLRIFDETAFYGVISTFDASREGNVDVALKAYLKYLENRGAKLEHSKPRMHTLRHGLRSDPILANQLSRQDGSSALSGSLGGFLAQVLKDFSQAHGVGVCSFGYERFDPIGQVFVTEGP